MHDQELIANVVDEHARGFQKRMNPELIRAKAQNRYPSASLSAAMTIANGMSNPCGNPMGIKCHPGGLTRQPSNMIMTMQNGRSGGLVTIGKTN